MFQHTHHRNEAETARRFRRGGGGEEEKKKEGGERVQTQKHHRVRDLRGSGVRAGAPVEIGQQEKRRAGTIGREDAETPRRIRRGAREIRGAEYCERR